MKKQLERSWFCCRARVVLKRSALRNGVIFLVLGFLAASTAEAVPTQLDGRITHIAHYTQTGAATHLPEVFSFIAFQQGIDLNSVTVTPPGKSPVSLTQIADHPTASSDQFRLENSFATYAALNTAYPGGTYSMNLTFANMSTLSYLLSIPSPLAFPTSIPTVTNYLPGTTVDSLTPTFNFNLFTAESWMLFQTISFVVFEDLPGDVQNSIYTANFVYNPMSPMTSFAIPSGVLNPGQLYELSIFFNGQPDSEFTGAQTSTSGVGNISFFEFQTPIPEPGTLLLLGSGLLGAAGYGWRRKRGSSWQLRGVCGTMLAFSQRYGEKERKAEPSANAARCGRTG